MVQKPRHRAEMGTLGDAVKADELESKSSAPDYCARR
jgi:hypothetical protein